jgi:chloride channel 3/4/5
VTTSNDTWRFFELVPWSILGITGVSYHQSEMPFLICFKGLLGALLIKLNTAVAVFRERSVLKNWPILEVVVVSGVTAAISYMV